MKKNVEKTEITLQDRFEKYCTPLNAKTILKLIDGKDIMKLKLSDLLAIPGMGRNRAMVVMSVACDIAGKK